MIDKIRMAHLTSQEARESLTAEAVVVLPMGSLEDQGTHAPMGDYMAADRVAVEMAKAARAKGVATFVAPVIPFGGKDYFESSHGGISISHATLAALLDDMFGCLDRHGIRRLMIVNGHGGNVPAITEVALRWRQKAGLFVPSMYLWQIGYGLLPAILGPEEAARRAGHGGDPLTSVALHFYPDLLRPDLARPAPKGARVKGLDIAGFSAVSYEGASIQVPIEALEATETGAYGCDPTLCRAETGAALVERLVAIGAGLIRDHVSRGLDEPRPGQEQTGTTGDTDPQQTGGRP